MNRVIPRIKLVFTKYPIVRGMVSYAIVWPIGNLAQQSIAGKRWDTYDWGKCLRFSLYGSFFVAPTLYTWIRVAGAMWPSTSFKTGLAKALTEQIAYTPGAMTCFYFIMSLLEFKTVHEAAHEVSTKFLPTYKVAICVWPILQTINFTFVPEIYRVPYVSICSFCWTTFLAYMKSLSCEEDEDIHHVSHM